LKKGGKKMKRKNLYFVVLAIVALFAIFVYADLHSVTQPSKFSITRLQNASGTIANLSVFITNINGSFQANDVVNVSIAFQYTLNNSFMANVTITNDTATTTGKNLSYFSTTFDTTSIQDGTYNFTIMVINMSAAGIFGVPTINNSVFQDGGVTTLRVDNTPPSNVTFSAPLISAAKTYKEPTNQGKNVLFNVSVRDTYNGTGSYGLIWDGGGVKSVIFQFTNGTKAFNVTATGNSSGYFGATVNISRIVEGNPSVVTVYAIDFAGSTNSSVTMNLNIDRTAPTVTLTKNDPNSDETQLTIDIATASDSEICTSSQGSVSGSAAAQTITATGLDSGTTYTFDVVCRDELGNTGSSSKSFTTDEAGGASSGAAPSSGSSSGSSGGTSSRDDESDDTTATGGTGTTTGETDDTAPAAGAGDGADVADAPATEPTGTGQDLTEGEGVSGGTVVIVALVVLILGVVAWLAMRKK
jgi:hypothetical protein